MIKDIEVFKTGKHVDSSGQEVTITITDLDTIVSKFNERTEEGERLLKVPATVGHVTSDKAPAFGWIHGMKRVGGKILADVGDTVSEFKELVEKKMYPNVSISLRKDLSPHHLAFLGGQPPAVKGMKSLGLDFSDEPSYYTFAEEEKENGFSMDNPLVSKLFSFMEKFLKAETSNPLQGEKKKMEIEKKLEELQTKFDKISEENKSFSEKNETLMKENKELSDKIKQGEFEKVKEGLNSFAEELVKQGKLLPAHKESIVETMLSIDNEKKLSFGEGEEKTEMTALEQYQGLLKSGPQVLNFKESKGEKSLNPDEELGKLARQKVSESGGALNFGEALRQARIENPKLASKA